MVTQSSTPRTQDVRSRAASNSFPVSTCLGLYCWGAGSRVAWWQRNAFCCFGSESLLLGDGKRTREPCPWILQITVTADGHVWLAQAFDKHFTLLSDPIPPCSNTSPHRTARCWGGRRGPLTLCTSSRASSGVCLVGLKKSQWSNSSVKIITCCCLHFLCF